MGAVGLGVGPVDLVEHDDRAQAQPQRLLGDEFGLRHRPLGGIDQQHDAVDHAEDALDLAAEIGVAGGIDDVDPDALPFHAGRLGQDGDAALAFQIVRIHRPLGDRLIVAKRPRLAEKLIDEGGLAMIDMGDDRDVANVHRAAFAARGRAPPNAAARQRPAFPCTRGGGARRGGNPALEPWCCR